jgi:D-amino peptidase
VFLSVDLEGISGVVDEEQTSSTGKDYALAREWMVGDANAAIEGAIEGGAAEVVVNDSHGSMRNLVYSQLHPEAILISGGGKPLSMVQGIDESFDVAFFIGYHARRSTQNATLDHTYTGKPSDVRINGKSYGETGINAGVCGHFGVPVGLVTGCVALCAEVEDALGTALTVAVKQGIARTAAKCFPQAQVRQHLRETAATAVKRSKSFQPLVFAKPTTVELDLMSTEHADSAARIPGVERLAARAVRLVGEDYLDLYQKLRLCV